MAFVTSRYTMDAKDSTVRRYLAQRAELLGPSACQTMRSRQMPELRSFRIFSSCKSGTVRWTLPRTGRRPAGPRKCFTVNQYFLDHPEMVLGQPTAESTQYGKQDYTVVPIEGLELADQLHDAVQHIHGTYQEAALPELGEGEDIDDSLPADPDVKNYSYTVVDGAVYFRENSRMVRPDLNATAEARVKGLVGLRDCVQQLIDLEMDAAAPDADIREQMAELNRLYDAFSAKYGLINDRANRLAFPMTAAITCSARWKYWTRMAGWSARQICSPSARLSPMRPSPAVDTPPPRPWRSPFRRKPAWTWPIWNSSPAKPARNWLTSCAVSIFRVPGQTEPDGTPHYVTADEYLSGNVRRKLRQAQRAGGAGPGLCGQRGGPDRRPAQGPGRF